MYSRLSKEDREAHIYKDLGEKDDASK